MVTIEDIVHSAFMLVDDLQIRQVSANFCLISVAFKVFFRLSYKTEKEISNPKKLNQKVHKISAENCEK